MLEYLDPTKEGLIPKGQSITTQIWLLNTLNDYLHLSGRDFIIKIWTLGSICLKTSISRLGTGSVPSEIVTGAQLSN